MNNKLTDTHLAVKSELDGYRMHASRGQHTARAMVRLFESIDCELAELQELRRNYLALRGEIEDVQSQLYEAESQANEYASELQELRKVEGIYHLATLYEIDGVFTKDPCVLANARGRKVQGYVELELANMFYKENHS